MVHVYRYALLGVIIPCVMAGVVVFNAHGAGDVKTFWGAVAALGYTGGPSTVFYWCITHITLGDSEPVDVGTSAAHKRAMGVIRRQRERQQREIA